MSTDSSNLNPSKEYKSIRLFENPILESLTHVHPSVPFVLWIPVIAYCCFHSVTTSSLSSFSIALYIAYGLLFWTLTEYLMHRYVFHFHATSRLGKYLVFLFHGIHHDDPQDPTRLVMPPVISLSLAPLFYFGFRLVFGAEKSLPLFSGFMAGYLIYDYIHFATHHFRPKTSVGKTLKENHMKHHFLAKKGKWGVSSPLWDHLFGTYKQE